MKNKLKIVVASAVIVGSAACAGYNYVKNRSVILPEGFTLTAHTGCEKTADNSLESIKKGYESGADIVEFDLSFAENGTGVLAHDGAQADSVTLDEAFAVISELEGLKVNVDAKSTANLSVVKELAEKYGILDRIFYTGIDEEDVEAVKQQTPDIAYWLNFQPDKKKKTDREYLISLAEKTEKLGAVGINLNHNNCTKELVEIFHEKGLLVSVWTVNKEIYMIRAAELGADNITTRQPTKLREIIKMKKA